MVPMESIQQNGAARKRLMQVYLLPEAAARIADAARLQDKPKGIVISELAMAGLPPVRTPHLNPPTEAQ